MKTRVKKLALLLVLGLLVMALTGCVHVRPVDPQAAPSFAELNRQAQKKSATVRLYAEPYAVVVRRADGGSRAKVIDYREVTVRSLQVTPDSTSWLNARTHQLETVSTAQIKEIRFVRRGRGALEGLGIGLLSGAALGAVLGYAACPCTSWFGEAYGFSRGYGAGVGVRVGGFLGGFLGLLVGSLSGSKQVYRFEAPAPGPPVIAVDARQQMPRRE